MRRSKRKGASNHKPWVAMAFLVVLTAGILFYVTLSTDSLSSPSSLTGAAALQPFSSQPLRSVTAYDRLQNTSFMKGDVRYIAYLSMHTGTLAPYICTCLGDRCPTYKVCRGTLGQAIPAEVCNDAGLVDEDEDVNANCLDLNGCYVQTNVCSGQARSVLLTGPRTIGVSGNIDFIKGKNGVSYVTGVDACVKENKGDCLSIEVYTLTGSVGRWEVAPAVNCPTRVSGGAYDLTKVYRAICFSGVDDLGEGVGRIGEVRS